MIEYFVYAYLAFVAVLIAAVLINEYRNRPPPGGEALLARLAKKPATTTRPLEIEPQQACFGLGDDVALDITSPFSEELVWDVQGTSKHGVPGKVKAITGYGMIDIEYQDGTVLRAYALCCRPVHAKSE